MDELKACPMKTREIIETLKVCAMENGCIGCPHEGQPGYDCLRSTMKAAADRLEELSRRATPENKPLTIDGLRQMDSNIAYIQFGDGAEGNAVLSWEGEAIYLYGPTFDDHEEPDLDFYGLEYNDPAGHFGLHLLGWRAYARKPGNKRCKAL